MDVQSRINAFARLGSFLRQFKSERENSLTSLNTLFYERFDHTIKNVHVHNPWFIESFVLEALHSWGELLKKNNLDHWLNKYVGSFDAFLPKRIGIVMAGNIPMVGFHDLLCVLLSGNIACCKLSSKDDKLIPLVMEVLFKIEPSFTDYVVFEEKLHAIDAVIATGSNNTSRYFEYYFGKYSHIIRKNRSSLAVLTDDENNDQLRKLADDIFLFFGLGCRNVSKLLVPEKYNFHRFFDAMASYEFISKHNKYANNYDYNRSVFLINQVKHLDNGFLLLKKDTALHSPLAVLYYQTYSKKEDVDEYISSFRDDIQCIICAGNAFENTLEPGMSQYPALWDYADNVDTLSFLSEICK